MSRRDETPAPFASGTAHPFMGVERGGCVAGAGGAGPAAGGVVNGRAAAASPAATEPPRKRLKLATAADEANALRRRICEHKLLRLKNLRERFTEQLSELYFLQAGGNMMDYVSWRRRPATPQLQSYVDARRPRSPSPRSAAAASSGAAGTRADEAVEAARAEAHVARRVAELARAGLWSERRLPRVLEPPRNKSHWDYLLEEMAWLAQDFAHERKWKKQAARKCARAVQKYFQDKAAAAQKAEKAQELQLKKIAAFAAKEIRTFWTNAEKLVEWKRVRKVERARKEALDEQLSYIVDRTERYSRQLAAKLAPAHSDDEFEPRASSSDDEETIAAAERSERADHATELEALRRESRLELHDLLPPGYLPAHSPPPSDYRPSDDSADDEGTIAEQEQHDPAPDAAAELARLRADADLSLDELRRKYAQPPPDTAPSPTHSTTRSDTGDDKASSTSEDADDDDDNDVEEEEEEDDEEEEAPLHSLMEVETSAETGADGERRVEAAAELAATLQPTGTTLAATAVGTPVPALLKHALREYQHVGLHWLATMHARRLNGILADEMGLGKTIQSIALLAHLAARGDWGPHLVVAPTSVVLNWEMEFKKWCPAFKILTYYGTIKERKLKRVGWTKPNSFHVCITSYKLVVQDHQSFRRKRWKYLILDEAQNIKNFKSQRWQMLLNFQTERRLLLTGTPLQNSLLELWSLMHFLMPDVFASHSEFREWFAPVAGLAEGGGGGGGEEALVRRLHRVLRPFLLRRLKRDVERQMPRKYDHVLMCRLATRQRHLYDDFMARAKTKESLASGNLLSVINVLMQLRKVCNHPDLFEPRPVQSPLQLPALRYCVPALALLASCGARERLAAALGGDLAALEAEHAGAFPAHRARHLAPPRRLVEELCAPAPAPPAPPATALRLHLRLVPRAPPTLPPTAVVAPSVPASRRSHATPPAHPAPTSGAAARLEARRRACLRRLAACNERRCWRLPLYGADLRAAVSSPPPPVPRIHRDLPDMLHNLHDLIDKFTVCWESCRAGSPQLVCGRGAGAWRAAAARGGAAARAARRLLHVLHAPRSRQAVAFPHPALLQYDCGKLQTLDVLLRRLKSGAHRVLIFSQMTRVLDVLEAFLSLHGHAYVRLDGATRLDMRQVLVDRFNGDPRIFAFILSTRSGGVGLNLTGADCVVFYDSDWNPTMDAQAQDRCHRIGQTRDVHVFRLVTQNTVEQNILRKADQKRALSHLAIEGGHFTTHYLKQCNIKELFESSPSDASVSNSGVSASGSGGVELESALAACEEEADAAAARAARAEASRDLAEFDETQPIDDAPVPPNTQDNVDPDAADFASLMKQLSPVEKYAMRMVEKSEAATEAERAALGEMRRQLREWEQARAALRSDASPPRARTPPPADVALTYCGGDARSKVWLSGQEIMPMWCPPTPPQGDGDVYCESWSRALYRAGPAAESLLPPPARRSPRPARSPRRARPALRAVPAPPSLFERAGRPRRLPHAPHAPRDLPQPEWAASEDAALRRALRLQRLPPDPPAALAPNWDWVADLVDEAARAHRSPRACRDRHDALLDPERARRRHRKPQPARRRPDDDAPRPPLHRLDAMRDAAERRRRAPKRRADDAAPDNPKHAALLADHGVVYDSPPTPMEVATRRAERIAKEKQKAGTPAAAPAAPLPAAAAPQPPQRVVVAAKSGEAARRSAPPQLLFRQQHAQALAARHHLKILHGAAPGAGVGAGAGVGGVVRRAAPAHVVVAHLAQRPTAPPPPPDHHHTQ